ncbi:MAG: DUF3572 domain-containing protein [Proteobacteria bacterium]|nr:DUF3572 domain-containing protein [Pseudomonadota bacterium]
MVLRETRTHGAGSKDNAEALAIEALVYLAQDEARLSRFMALTGLEAQDLRAAAAAPGFLAHVLDYVGQDESLLIAFAAEKHMVPEAIMRAARLLAGDDAPREGTWRESW